MTLQDARQLRDEIRAAGIHCVTPTGHGPDGYFAAIVTTGGEKRFAARDEWLVYEAARPKPLPGRPFSRIVIETLRPSGQRTSDDLDSAIESQTPVSEWTDIGDAMHLMNWLRHNMPITQFGLLYGLQHKQDESAKSYAEEAAKLKTMSNDETQNHFNQKIADIAARRERAINSVHGFVAKFDVKAYGLAEALSWMPATIRRYS